MGAVPKVPLLAGQVSHHQHDGEQQEAERQKHEEEMVAARKEREAYERAEQEKQMVKVGTLCVKLRPGRKEDKLQF